MKDCAIAANPASPDWPLAAQWDMQIARPFNPHAEYYS